MATESLPEKWKSKSLPPSFEYKKNQEEIVIAGAVQSKL